jgi:hypothetical protein
MGAGGVGAAADLAVAATVALTAVVAMAVFLEEEVTVVVRSAAEETVEVSVEVMVGTVAGEECHSTHCSRSHCRHCRD